MFKFSTIKKKKKKGFRCSETPPGKQFEHHWAGGSQVPLLLKGSESVFIAHILCASIVRAKLLQLHLTLCDLMDCSPQGSSVLGILQARMLEWFACRSPADFPDPGIQKQR